jgi:hypothetical protein
VVIKNGYADTFMELDGEVSYESDDETDEFVPISEELAEED